MTCRLTSDEGDPMRRVVAGKGGEKQTYEIVVGGWLSGISRVVCLWAEE